MAPWLSDDFFLLSMSGVAIISAGGRFFGALEGDLWGEKKGDCVEGVGGESF